MRIQSLIFAISSIVLFGAGWQFNEWRRDSIDFEISLAIQETAERSREIASQSSRKLEQQLEAIRNAAPKNIYREVVKPVFTNVCVSDEFVSLYNENVTAIERALSGEFKNKMSAY